MLEKYPNDVKLVFKHFPLQMHPYARVAATASMAAAAQGKFWEYHDLVFRNYKELNELKLRQLAAGLGLDMNAWDRAIVSPEIVAAVSRDMKEAIDAGVKGTPFLYVNGRLVRNRTPEGIYLAIDTELRKASRGGE